MRDCVGRVDVDRAQRIQQRQRHHEEHDGGRGREERVAPPHRVEERRRDPRDGDRHRNRQPEAQEP
jgi:hypothetical protein